MPDALVAQRLKRLPCNAGDLGSIPELGKSPGEGNGNPLQYPCLENLMDGGTWWATVHCDAKSQTRLSDPAIDACLQDLLELTPKNDVLFIIGDWYAEVGS